MDDQNTHDPTSNQDLTDIDDIKHQQAKPPSVVGEEDPFSGDATSSEAVDIDSELGKVGLSGDDSNSTPDPLDFSQEIDDDEKAA